VVSLVGGRVYSIRDAPCIAPMMLILSCPFHPRGGLRQAVHRSVFSLYDCLVPQTPCRRYHPLASRCFSQASASSSSPSGITLLTPPNLLRPRTETADTGRQVEETQAADCQAWDEEWETECKARTSCDQVCPPPIGRRTHATSPALTATVYVAGLGGSGGAWSSGMRP